MTAPAAAAAAHEALAALSDDQAALALLLWQHRIFIEQACEEALIYRKGAATEGSAGYERIKNSVDAYYLRVAGDMAAASRAAAAAGTEGGNPVSG